MLKLFLIVFAAISLSLADQESDCIIPPLVCEEKCITYVMDEENECPTCECAEYKSNRLFEMDIRMDRTAAKNVKRWLNGRCRAGGESQSKWFMYRNGDHWEVPFVLENTISNEAISGIAQAITDFIDNTCIRFVPRTDHSKYIYFIKRTGCWSYVGVRESGINYISLDDGCEGKGIVIHEIMHAIGFWHEQSRPDRDDYVKIIWDNIRSGMQNNFQKFNDIESYGVPYDTFSVMHYPNWAFSKNGQDTIVNANMSKFTTYQRDGFSDSDIEQINAMYQCDSMPPPTSGPQTTQAPTGTAETSPEKCNNIWEKKVCKRLRRNDKCGEADSQINCRRICKVCRRMFEYNETTTKYGTRATSPEMTIADNMIEETTTPEPTTSTTTTTKLTTTTPGCADVPDFPCIYLVEHCGRSDLMRKKCPASCGFCG